MNRFKSSIPPVAALLLLLAPVTESQAMDALQALKTCARTVDDSARALCYEDLGKQALATETEAVSSTADSADKAARGLPEDLGGATFSQKEENNNAAVSGLVTSCLKGADGKWYFIFAQGQVWKQVSDDRLRFNECNFEATIDKDFFGYKMRIDGKRRYVRIRRHR